LEEDHKPEPLALTGEDRRRATLEYNHGDGGVRRHILLWVTQRASIVGCDQIELPGTEVDREPQWSLRCESRPETAVALHRVAEEPAFELHHPVGWQWRRPTSFGDGRRRAQGNKPSAGHGVGSVVSITS
jgi:hypothetical protein